MYGIWFYLVNYLLDCQRNRVLSASILSPCLRVTGVASCVEVPNIANARIWLAFDLGIQKHLIQQHLGYTRPFQCHLACLWQEVKARAVYMLADNSTTEWQPQLELSSIWGVLSNGNPSFPS